MKLRKLDATTPPEMRRAAELVEALGAPDFAARLLRALQPRLPASHCTVFALRASGRAEAVASASTIGEVATLTAIEYMRLGFDQQDSNMIWLARRKPGRRLQLWIGHQLAEEVAQADYRRVCYGEPGVRERLSLLAVFADGTRVATSFYRNHAYAAFAETDRTWLGEQAPLLLAAVRRHMQLARATPAQHPLQQALMTRLSARERQLISHVLDGKTTKEAAREMGVSTTTALTYRYRAFQHLGVRSARELMALVGQAGPA
ncbi:helix-turn-helix transcriptional regulator [Ramlibacter sp. AW1]|uniref:Helix-turn-helix transcriptional regulator n=1 Tax=Ramlibacter aurantiacus TaxID=2801330 RepID=A0A936ZGZ7_9BURK|nr:helix-turn-helix transcriptional regulator [Ramlibacter aurantiacus]MBL0420747.1 helix-turn-helix transcriptional regulator [Ramlibacter aurantiacus]